MICKILHYKDFYEKCHATGHYGFEKCMNGHSDVNFNFWVTSFFSKRPKCPWTKSESYVYIPQGSIMKIWNFLYIY